MIPLNVKFLTVYLYPHNALVQNLCTFTVFGWRENLGEEKSEVKMGEKMNFYLFGLGK